jgi:Second Messenger Oligonucleotide or Dinucleotide Synthetase domain
MGGSGGGGGPYYNVSPEELKGRVREATEEIAKQFAPRLQLLLDDKLRGYNERDTRLIRQRQEAVLDELEDLLDATWDLKLGGSVAKHTYVDGLSDVDSLLIIRDAILGQKPAEILKAVGERLSAQLRVANIRIGKIAITMSYEDGMELQLIPAVRDGNKIRVPSWTRDGWSRIDPQAFTGALTRRNQQCEGKLVPTIKLAKAIIANWPDSVRLSGYHVESLAIDAFRGYKGPYKTGAMLPYFFERAAMTVLAPIKDSTGQSVHVDQYLGKARSELRQKASHWCSQVAKRMKNASFQASLGQWRELFDD